MVNKNDQGREVSVTLPVRALLMQRAQGKVLTTTCSLATTPNLFAIFGGRGRTHVKQPVFPVFFFMICAGLQRGTFAVLELLKA